jgi:hypothetical protein
VRHATSLCIFVSLWFVAGAAAQTSRIEGGSTTLGNIVFYYETRLEPPVPPLGDSLNMVIFPSNNPNVRYNGAAPDTVHRVMLDRTRKVYFGYDARISVVGGRVAPGQPGETRYQVAFGPLTVTPDVERMLGPAAAWKLLPAPKFPGPRTIRPYEVLELPMLTNDTWGQRLTEYVTVGEAPRQGFNPGRRREFAFAVGSARDFTAADVVMTLTEPRIVWSNAKAGAWVVDYSSRAEATGGILWIYAPNEGRFLLSLVPRAEFLRAGSVRGTSLTFTANGTTYNVSSATRIAPGDAVFNLYVLHQPNWKPTYDNANLETVHIGSADRTEYLVGKR